MCIKKSDFCIDTNKFGFCFKDVASVEHNLSGSINSLVYVFSPEKEHWLNIESKHFSIQLYLLNPRFKTTTTIFKYMNII